VPELIPTGSEAEWLEARRKGVTASEIAVLMGLSPYSSPYALYHQKLGILPPVQDTPAMERGRVLEPYVAEKFAAAHPELYVAGNGRELYGHPDRPWQMATPDRLAWESDRHYAYHREPVAVLECKTDAGSGEWGEPGTDEIPVHYRAQALWQMDVMGVSTAYVACLDIRQWEVREYVIGHDGRDPWDDANHGEGCDACADQYMMRDAGAEFLGRIERQEPPDVDWRPATLSALKALHPSVTDTEATVGVQLAARYRAAAANHKKWEQRKKLYEAQLRQHMGSARRAALPSGEAVARRDVYEVRESLRKAYTVDKIVATPPKPEKDKSNGSPDDQ
jgi:putative phage-type endonuclease